jgi:hypothetical protein
MDYLITTYPTMYRRYLVKDVNTIEEAWDVYYSPDYDYNAMFLDEEFIGDDDGVEIELLTPELRDTYGLPAGKIGQGEE